MLELVSARAREEAPLLHRAAAGVKHYLIMLRELKRLARENQMDSGSSSVPRSMLHDTRDETLTQVPIFDDIFSRNASIVFTRAGRRGSS